MTPVIGTLHSMGLQESVGTGCENRGDDDPRRVHVSLGVRLIICLSVIIGYQNRGGDIATGQKGGYDKGRLIDVKELSESPKFEKKEYSIFFSNIKLGNAGWGQLVYHTCACGG